MSMTAHKRQTAGPAIPHGIVAITKDGVAKIHPLSLAAIGAELSVAIMYDRDRLTLSFCRVKGSATGYKVIRQPTSRAVAVGISSALKAMGVNAAQAAGRYDAAVDTEADTITIVFPVTVCEKAEPQRGPMSPERIREIVRNIDYRDGWTLLVDSNFGTAWIQWRFADEMGIEQYGRKWLISTHSLPCEVLQTAFAAALMCEEHEARERFRYCDKPLFHPHHSIDALMAIADEVERRS